MHQRIVHTIDQTAPGPFELKNACKHVAYLFSGSKLLATSTNRWGCHAEIAILTHVRFASKKRLRIYIQKVGGIHQNSRPCHKCSQILKREVPWVRIFYSLNGGEWREDVALDSTHLSRREVDWCGPKRRTN